MKKKKVAYAVTMTFGSDTQEEFITEAFKMAMEALKVSYTEKHKDNKFDYQLIFEGEDDES